MTGFELIIHANARLSDARESLLNLQLAAQRCRCNGCAVQITQIADACTLIEMARGRNTEIIKTAPQHLMGGDKSEPDNAHGLFEHDNN